MTDESTRVELKEYLDRILCEKEKGHHAELRVTEKAVEAVSDRVRKLESGLLWIAVMMLLSIFAILFGLWVK